MAGMQLSVNCGVAGVKRHPEPTQAELIATIWGEQKVRVWSAGGERIDLMHGPLTAEQAKEASFFYMERGLLDPLLRISHPTVGVLEMPFSITMPTESHQTAYSSDAGCIAIKLSRVAV